MVPKVCSVEGCDKPSKTRGWCNTHHVRWFRHGDPLGSAFGDAETRFWRHVDRRGVDECWLWTGGTLGPGYGSFSENGKTVGAHRYSLTLSGSLNPGGLFACHHCDNKLCVNPGHLYWGTPQANSTDAALRGRMMRGEGHSMSKLTTADVVALRREYAAGADSKWLADTYGVCRGTIYTIANGRTWKHAGGPITHRRKTNRKKAA